MSAPIEGKASNGVVVAYGYGVRVGVWRGRLEVDDGVASDRRLRRFHRATSGLKRLVVLGHTGYVTLDALRWIADIKAGYLQIDQDGRVLAAFGPAGTDRPALRRAQAMASQTEQALELSKWMVDAKLTAQVSTLTQFLDRLDVAEAVSVIEGYRKLAADAETTDQLRSSEAWAAGAYWQTLAPLEIRFARRDADQVPSHWRTFGGRSSPLASGPRRAANPANAVLNYSYALLESEATLAARIVGLDPGIGLMHVDQAFRESLAADLMEPVRPAVDAYVFELLTSRPFAARDFLETRTGVCRLSPLVARELAEECRRWGHLVGRVAEDLARKLEPKGTNRRGSPTPVSGRRRAETRPTGPKAVTQVPTGAAGRGCSWCGGKALAGRATCSNDCADQMLRMSQEQFARAGAERMRRYDRTNHPGLTVDANQKRAATRRRNHAAEMAWDREKPATVDVDLFRTEIQPKLSLVSATAIARATGLSVGHCAKIKRGEVVPHPMWWAAISSVSVGR